MRDIKPDSGVLFENEKPTSDKSPAYRGNFFSGNSKFSLSAWNGGAITNYTTPGRGILFENHNKTTENQPDMIGSITMPDSVRYSVSGWHRTSKEGNHYISLSLRTWSGQFSEVPMNHLSLGCKAWIDGGGR